MRYDPTCDICETLRTTGGANGLAIDDRGRLYPCESTYRRVVTYDGKVP